MSTHAATSYVEDLLTQGYFLIPVPEELEGLYIRAHELWERLCQYYGEDGLLQFSFKLYVGELADGLTPEADDGYLPRGGVRPEDGVRYDSKHTWHHRPRLWPHMAEVGAMRDPVMGSVWTEFMVLNQRIWEIHRDAARLFAEGLDAHPRTRSYDFGQKFAMTEWLMPLRHILYRPGVQMGARDGVEEGVAGKPHHDRNWVTFHGFEKVGTVQGFIDGEWRKFPERPHHLCGFGGILMAIETGAEYSLEDRRTTGGVIPALDHRGMADPSRPHAARKASVSFAMHRAYRIQ